MQRKRKKNSEMIIDCPRIAFSALRGNSGKTFMTTGVTAYLRKEGKAISPFKKGPDYIDAAWLGLAAGRLCYNLDAFMMKKDDLFLSFLTHTSQADGALLEGNRGLFDGMDREGSYSTAELAKMLKIPVILIVDCTMATRTVAAMVLGCQNFDLTVPIKGVILNRIRGGRHESIVRAAVEEYCGVPVLGTVPNIKGRIFPERHMGLIPPQEHPGASKSIDEAAGMAERFLDMQGIWKVACGASPLCIPGFDEDTTRGGLFSKPYRKPRIGVVRDSAFWFYYPDNLEALEKLGAEMVDCNALAQQKLPEVDALYIGGGFPETHAEALACNIGFRRSLLDAVEIGLPVYAECGGLMYLGEKLVIEGRTFPMAGVFPFTFALQQRPKAHGYTILEADQPNPYFKVGETIHGHEFHYSRILDWEEKKISLALKMRRGYGLDGRRDGLCYKRVMATYSHLHVLGTKGWARSFFDQAVSYSREADINKEDLSFYGRRLPAALNF